MKKINVFVQFQTTSAQGGVEVWTRFLYDLFKKKYSFCEYYQKEQTDFYNNEWLEREKNVEYKFLGKGIDKRNDQNISTIGIINSKKNETFIFNTHDWFDFFVLRNINIESLKSNRFIFVDHGGIWQVLETHKQNKVFLPSQKTLDFFQKFTNFKVVTFTQKNKEIFLKLGFPEKCIIIIPLFSKLEHLEIPNNPSKKYDLCFIGRIAQQKNVEEILTFAKKYNLSIVVVGGIQYKKKTKEFERISKMLAYPNVTYKGIIQNEATLIDILISSKFFILNSWHEGMPFVLIEALSIGIPILVKDSFAASKFLTDENRNGLLYRKKLNKKVFKKILPLDLQYSQIQKNCKTFYNENLTKNKFIKNLDDLIEKW